MKKLLLALALTLLPSIAWAQNPTCPDRPNGDKSNACANTRFVINNGGGGGGSNPTGPAGGSLSGTYPNPGLASQNADIYLGNITGPAFPAAQALPNCHSAASAVTYTPGVGFGCNTITTALPSIASGHLIANSTAGTTTAGDTAPSAWFDRAFCSTVGQLLTRIAGVWVCSAGVPVDLAWFGVNSGNTAATNSTNIATALGACGTCRFLLSSSGTVQFNSTITLGDKAQLECQSIQTNIQTTANNIDTILINGGGDQLVHNCQFSTIGSQTGTQTIHVNGAHNFKIDRVVITGGYIGITIEGNNSFIGFIEDTEIGSTSNAGIVVGTSGSPADIHIINTHVTSAGGAGVACINSGGIQIVNSDLLLNNQGLSIVPGNGQVCTAIQVINTYLDSSVNNNLQVAVTGTGKFTSSFFTNTWFASGNGNAGTTGTGVSISGGSGTSGIVFDNCIIFNNYNGGFYAINADHITLSNSLIISNNQGNNAVDGVNFGTNNAYIKLVNNSVGSAPAMISNLHNQVNGITISGACNVIVVTGNDTISGNTTGYNISGGCTNIVNANNL